MVPHLDQLVRWWSIYLNEQVCPWSKDVDHYDLLDVYRRRRKRRMSTPYDDRYAVMGCMNIIRWDFQYASLFDSFTWCAYEMKKRAARYGHFSILKMFYPYSPKKYCHCLLDQMDH